MSPSPVIVWLRQDLRLSDNPALYEAAQSGRPVIPVFIHDENDTSGPGSASCWWLHHSLLSLKQSLRSIGSDLILRRGNAMDELQKLVEETGATSLFRNRCYEPYAIERDKIIMAHFRSKGVGAQCWNASLLHEPEHIRTKSGNPFRVFTPFYKTCIATLSPEPPLPAPDRLIMPDRMPASLRIEELALLPSIRWDKKLEAHWRPGEDGAHERLRHTLDHVLAHYQEGRDRPDHDYTSRLSPHLHRGEISPRQIWHAAGDKSESFIRELFWREFSYHLLYHFPSLPHEPLQEKFRAFPWDNSDNNLKAWQKGLTGYPIVDAGMRQLWDTGWMHNRVRMIVGSFLIKDLLLHWHEGEKWFWDCLVDADLANNAASWQWIAGCGADAAPFFRVFNPVTQGEKFDPNGDYVRAYIPALKDVPAKFVHKPWEAPSGPPPGYPAPIVDHARARMRALAAFEMIKKQA